MVNVSYNLTINWVWTRLEEISDIILGQSPPSSTYNEIGNGLPFYQGKSEFGDIYPTPQKWCIAPKKIAEKGDVLISVRAPVGPTNICPEKSCIGRGLAAIRPLGGIETFFTLYLMRAFKNSIIGKGTGTTFDAITGIQLKEFAIPLPPLPEQRAIVSKIEQLFSDLDNGIDNFKKAQAQLKLYHQSVLKAACEGKLVPTEAELARAQGRDYEAADVLLARILKKRREKWNGKGKYKEPEALDTSGMPKLPEGWFWTRFEQIVSLSQNGFGKRLSKEGNPTIVLRLADITNGEISLNNVRRIGATIWEIEKYKLLNNDLLCIRVNGSRNLVGRMIRYKPVPEPITFCDHFIRFQLVEPTITHFLSIYFNTERVRKFVEFNMVSTAGQNTVSQVTIMAIAFPLPPLAEQHRIVAEVERRLTISDKMEATITESLQKAESLRQGILKKAFEGKLLNKKELEKARSAPDWEPAEKLLERIRQEKERTGEKKRKR